MELEYLREICIGETVNQYSLEEVNILSPYLSNSFFDKLKLLNPKKVYITTDAGCSTNVIENIKKTLNNKVQIRLAYCDGIVHAKCYLFRWKKENTENGYRSLLLWGSCNASDGGFERNAEIFSWIPLSKIDKEKQNSLLDYFSNLRTRSNDGVNGREINITNELTIQFPDIEFYTKEASTFDLWIQKGRLCHPFPNDPKFRHLQLRLLNKISPKDELSVQLKKNNLEGSQKTTISYDYLRQQANTLEEMEIETDDSVTSKWKSKYFVDTVYGFWTSDDCYKQKKAGFHKKDSNRRAEEIHTISTACMPQRMKWSNKFLLILESIDNSILNSDSYFHYKNEALDVDKYQQQFANQLTRDFTRSQDSWFSRGYISGFDFPEVPQMREFSSNWNEFITSFAEALFFQVNKSGTGNQLAKALRDIGVHNNGFDDSESFLNDLRENWYRYKNKIEKFYDD